MLRSIRKARRTAYQAAKDYAANHGSASAQKPKVEEKKGESSSADACDDGPKVEPLGAEPADLFDDVGELIKEADVKKWSTYHYTKKYIALYEKCLLLKNSTGPSRSSIRKLKKSFKGMTKKKQEQKAEKDLQQEAPDSRRGGSQR